MGKKCIKDPEHIDLNVPRHAQYVHKAWKKHQNTVYWVDIDLAIQKGLTFYQTRTNPIILQETVPAYCIPKVVRLKTGEVLGQSPETFTGRILFMSMFNDLSCDKYDNKEQCLKNAEFVKTFAKRFGIGQWSFIGPGSEKKWYPSENSPQGAWDHVAEDMLLRFAESAHPIFRATTPLSRGKLKSKGKGKVSIHFSAEPDTFDTIDRIILSVNQLSVYGSVAAFCDEYEGHPDSTGEPVILVGQSIVLGEVKAEAPVHDKEPRDDQIILQQYVQQVESLSPENKLSKFCKDLCVLLKLDNIS